MRKVMVMNEKYIEHNGTEYHVKLKKWTLKETTYTVIDTFKTLEEVVESLKVEYNHIQFFEGITSNERLDLYLGFNNGIKENIKKHMEKHKFSNYKLLKDELEIVLENMTNIHFSSLEGNFYFKPFLGEFGGHESINIRAEGKCFFKPSTMGKNKIKVANSFFSYRGNAYISFSDGCKSLKLKIIKGRRIIDLKFVPRTKRD